MKWNLVAAWALPLVLFGASVITAPSAYASDLPNARKSAEALEGYEEVELFSGIASGEIEVQFIPRDATQATVIFTNKTDRPLSIKLPDAFAGVPVLPQMAGMGGPGMGGMGGGLGGMGGGGGNQGMGGGFGGGMGGGGFGGMGGGMGGMGGFMNLAPEKVGRVRVQTMCLEHDKDDPNPHLRYEIRPISEFTDHEEIAEVCKMLARDEVSQNIAQAVAWNVMDGLSWQELAFKDRVRLSNGYVEKWFSYDELMFAQRALAVAAERARASEQTESSPGEAYNR